MRSMKKIVFAMALAALIFGGCGLGTSGPTFEEVFKANKGLMDSVKTQFKTIESLMNDSISTITQIEKVEKLPVPIVYDGTSNNNLEIVPMSALKDPESTFAAGIFSTGDLFNGLQWTGPNSSINGETLKEEAGDYAIEVFKNVREKSRYIAVYRYVEQIDPRFTSPSEFEVGYVDMEVVLFDMKTAQKLGAFRFVAESDSLVNYEYPEGSGDEVQVAAGTTAAVTELEGKCKWMIKKGLLEITGSELGIWVDERAGPYFVEKGDERIENARDKE